MKTPRIIFLQDAADVRALQAQLGCAVCDHGADCTLVAAAYLKDPTAPDWAGNAFSWSSMTFQGARIRSFGCDHWQVTEFYPHEGGLL